MFKLKGGLGPPIRGQFMKVAVTFVFDIPTAEYDGLGDLQHAAIYEVDKALRESENIDAMPVHFDLEQDHWRPCWRELV